MQFFLRKPIFPMVCSIDGYFIGAKTNKYLAKELSKLEMQNDGFYDLADITGEGWSLYPEKMIISPLSIKKRWTKKEIIALFNNRTNLECGNGFKYSEKSISSKKFDRIISEIVELATENI